MFIAELSVIQILINNIFGNMDLETASRQDRFISTELSDFDTNAQSECCKDYTTRHQLKHDFSFTGKKQVLLVANSQSYQVQLDRHRVLLMSIALRNLTAFIVNVYVNRIFGCEFTIQMQQVFDYQISKLKPNTVNTKRQIWVALRISDSITQPFALIVCLVLHLKFVILCCHL